MHKNILLNSRRGKFIAVMLGFVLMMNLSLPALAEEVVTDLQGTAQDIQESVSAEEIPEEPPVEEEQESPVVSGTDGEETTEEIIEVPVEEETVSDNELEELPVGTVSPTDGTVTPFDGSELVGHSAKLSQKSITLYLAKKNPTAETICYFNSFGDYEIQEGSLLPTKVNKIPYAPKLSLESISYNGLPAFKITASGNAASVKKGTYTYKLKAYDKERKEELKAVTLKVLVKAETVYPAMQINTTKVVLNEQLAGDYAYVYAVTEGAKIQPLNNIDNPAKVGKGLDVRLVNENTARITIKDKAAKGSALKATLYFYYGPEWNYKVVKKTISAKRVSKEPKITLTAKSGSKLDAVQRMAYDAQYVPKISNTGFVLKDVRISDPDQNEFNRQFLLEKERDGNGDIRSVTVRLKEDAKIYPETRNYGIVYTLHGPGNDAKEFSGTIPAKIKTVQSNVTMKNKTKASLKLSLSQGASGAVCYMVNSPVFASISEESIVENFNIKIPQGAFTTKVTVDPYGHLAMLEIQADASKVSVGKKYTLNYLVYPNGGNGSKCAKLKINVSIKE